MSLFEYLAIAFSIIFSFSAMRLVSGLPHALRADRRYWIHTTFVALQLITTVVVFWNYWNFASYADWTLPKFMLILASPALVYLNACTLIPERADTVGSWKDYYYSVCRRYFLGVGAWLLAVAANSLIFLDIPLVEPARFVQFVALLLCAVGVSSRVPSVHAGLAIVWIVLMSIWAFIVSVESGWSGR